ncbi:MAG: DUF484 family protein [Rhodocyclaceae bacterium]|nr:DUF484 family protein [Rhodocyclaceae bacterium]
MTPDDVLRYLRDHPEFLEAHAAAIAELRIPHPESGRAISINERQLLTLRERCRVLEAQLGTWVETGRANDQRGERMHQLVLRVMAAPRTARVDALLDGLRGTFDIPWVYLSVANADQPALLDHPGATTAAGCGPVVDGQAARLSELAGQTIGSLAWIPVDSGSGQRLLLLGSADPTRFAAQAGTQYLERVGDLLRVLLDGDG